MNKHTYTAATVLLALMLALGGCLGGAEAPPADGGGEPNYDAEVIEHGAYLTEYGTLAVGGVVENTGSETIPFLEVHVRVYDDNGTRIAEGYTNTAELEPGERWRFDVEVGETNGADRYEITMRSNT